jgi:hypothetical protein
MYIMQGTILYGPRDVRFQERPNPTIIEPTDFKKSLLSLSSRLFHLPKL